MAMFCTILFLFLLSQSQVSHQSERPWFESSNDVLGLEDAARVADIDAVNLTSLIETNEGYRNLTGNGVPKTRVVGIISAVAAGFGLLKGIAEQIDVSRVCAIALSNKGNRKLVEPSWYMDAGVIKDPLPREIISGDAGVFTFEKTSYSTYGTSGILAYTVEGTNTQIEVMWSVPMVYGIYSNRFNVKITTNDVANETSYDALYDQNYQEVSSSGHWMHRKGYDITVHAAMTNNAKASLLVEVFYNMTGPVTGEIFGK